jgi:hypothetical protein
MGHVFCSGVKAESNCGFRPRVDLNYLSVLVQAKDAFKASQIVMYVGQNAFLN